jgi:hypothetical protein
MATITPYKIATRTWAHNTMGSAAKLSYSTGNDCLIVSDINQDSSAYIITPSSTSNGAVPSSSLSDSSKCIKQSDLDDMYKKHYVNIDAKIICNTATNLVFGKYNLKINVFYENVAYNTSYNYPKKTGILKDIEVSIVIKCLIKGKPTERATTTTGCVLLANPLSTGVIGMECLDIKNQATQVGSSSTGTLDNNAFMGHYLEDMYKYYNGGTSTYDYSIEANITPEYGVQYSSIFGPQKYVPLPVSVVTSTSSNMLSANVSYLCTSNNTNNTIPNVTNTWSYKIVVSNIVPAVSSTPASSITVTTDKGTISRSNSWDGTNKKLTITGTVTYTPSHDKDYPNVTFIYARSGYVSIKRIYPVNTVASGL